MDRVIVLVGPTAVGKTGAAVALAERLGAEIISGDSMLVYRGLDIGTAKPTPAERARAPHHLIDILEPDESFSVTQFCELARAKIRAINAAGRLPILAGGTGLYVRALLEAYQFNAIGGDEAYRRRLAKMAAARGGAYVHALLAREDAAAAARLHPNDLRRVIRALEVRQIGGEAISEVKRAAGGRPVYDAAVVGLTMERAALYARINRRVDDMLAAGLVEEVEGLLRAGVPRDCQAMRGIGYKEVVACLDGRIERERLAAAIQQATRRFAKRQWTWFRKMPYISWLDVTGGSNREIMEKIYMEIAGRMHL